jgi:hypothetical protein
MMQDELSARETGDSICVNIHSRPQPLRFRPLTRAGPGCGGGPRAHAPGFMPPPAIAGWSSGLALVAAGRAATLGELAAS